MTALRVVVEGLANEAPSAGDDTPLDAELVARLVAWLVEVALEAACDGQLDVAA